MMKMMMMMMMMTTTTTAMMMMMTVPVEGDLLLGIPDRQGERKSASALSGRH